MRTDLLVGIACAILFFRAARYERMAAWMWVLASGGLSLIASLIAGIGLVLLTQIGLFALMWWYNAYRHSRPGAEGPVRRAPRRSRSRSHG